MKNKLVMTECLTRFCTLRPYIVLICAVFFNPSSFAGSIFIGHASTERQLTVGETLQALSPNGMELFLSFDLNDKWSINADYSVLDDVRTASNNNNVINLDYELDSLGVGLSYFADNWAMNYQFSGFEQQQDIFGSRPTSNGLITATQGDSHSLSASYFINLDENWQLSTALGLHYNDWNETNTQIINTPPNNDNPGNSPTPLAISESGDASLVSLSVNANRYSILTVNTGMTLGVFVGWNEVLDSQSQLRSINNRNINPIRGSGNANNNFVITGGESYGIASVYLSFDFYEDWILDFDFNSDFGTGDSVQTWSVGLGYLF